MEILLEQKRRPLYLHSQNASLAQLVEQLTCNQ